MSGERAVVFDLFHTLIDPEPLLPAGFSYRDEIVAELGFDRDDFVVYWDGTSRERETTPVDLVEVVARYARRIGVELEPAARRRIDGWFGVAKDDALRQPPAGIVELLTRLAGQVRLAGLSNCYEREVRAWPESPLAPLVDPLIRSCDIAAMKPEPAAYRAVIDAVAIGPEHMIYVANGSSDELVGARDAGFGAVVHQNAFDRTGRLVPEGEQRRRAAQADRSADSVAELASILDQLLG